MAGRIARNPAQRERLLAARTLGVSPRRFNGWEPAETHRGYDADGNQVPIAEAFEVVVTREPEWSDDDRFQMLALGRFEAEVCACGFHLSFITDDQVFMPESRKCPVCAGLDQEKRHLSAQDEQERAKRTDATPARKPMAADGRHTHMRIVPPYEVEQLRTRGQVNRGHKA